VHKVDAAALVELTKVLQNHTATPFQSPVKDFYFTKPNRRCLRTMAECSP
jgi:hypothetical protein